MKPDWGDMPTWANFIAMDANGAWGAFEEEPELGDFVWVNESAGGRAERVGQSSPWKHTLEPRP